MEKRDCGNIRAGHRTSGQETDAGAFKGATNSLYIFQCKRALPSLEILNY